MPLVDFDNKRKTIKFEDGEFSVRAVSLPDVARLVARNQDAMDRIAALIEAQRLVAEAGDTPPSEMTIGVELIFRFVQESPFVAADLISCCADEPEAWDMAYRLPLPLQVEALQAIADLTFADGMALKKFIADVGMLLRGMLPPQTVTAA